MSTLVIENVCKNYGDVKSVRGVTLNVQPGERVALLGHNGAGKTTLMRMILGLTPASSGKITVLGSAPGSRHARTSIGFLPENVAFHGALTARELLRHFARLKGANNKSVDDLLERVGLSHAMNRKIRTYSKGMRQRVGLAQALLGKPMLALLDEPTSGLDPISRHEFYDLVDDLAQGGTAVLLSSHALTELESRTDRVAIMSAGRLVADAPLPELRTIAHLPIRLHVKTAAVDADTIAAKLGGTRMNGQSINLTCQQDEKMALLAKIMALGATVEDVEMRAASLEELYRYYSTEHVQ